MSQTGWQVHKFGGSSVRDAACFRRVRDILHQDGSERLAVVVSAMGGMTDALLALVNGAEKGDKGLDAGLQALRDRYETAARELLEPAAQKLVLTAFEADIKDASDVIHAVLLVGSAAERSRDIVAGFGELWSARLMAAFLDRCRKQDPRGRAVRWVDTRALIVVDHGELGPAVAWDKSRANVPAAFRPEEPGIVVVTGFIASDSGGLQTTLGRNGSDFSASIMGALLGADVITIWTDVDGVMSADPNRVPEAAIINDLSYNEAMELAYFGAKVIHPQTMSPAVAAGIPIYIRNTFKPSAPGSKVSSSSPVGSGIKGITTVENIALVNVEGTGMIGVPGTADRLFGALRAASISVILISQASSEHSICFAVPGKMAERVEKVVRDAFAVELEQNQIQRVEVRTQCAIIAVVGDGMAGMPGIASRFFNSLGNAGISVRAIAQGSSERNISAVIDQAEATRALRAAHAGFYLSSETISVGLLGPGNVGGTLLDQMAAQAEHLRKDFNLDFRVRGIATSARMFLADKSLDLAAWREVIKGEGEALDLAKFARHINADHLPHAVIVDCTASSEIAARYVQWCEAGIHIVTPNKKAQSGPLPQYDEIHRVRRRHRVHFLYETSVGAALPIIQTLRDLKDTGDDIVSIEGIFSGTLAYLFNVYNGTRPFSAIVRDARDNGYTEPDPRDDLSGMDVARKVIILARELGLRLELSDIKVESLVPAGLDQGDAEAFLDSLPVYDEAMLARWKAASARGEVQRYVGRLHRDGTATVRLESLPGDHPFAHINLTDNIVRFVSGRYSDNPLVVQGPGAGPAVTAAGVFADLLRLARYLGARD